MAVNKINPILLRTERTKLLQELDLLRSGGDDLYDRLTDLASEIIGTPVSLLSIVVSDRQVFKSEHGLADPWKAQGETSLSHSFCQHVVATNQPLIVEDARKNDLLKDNLAIPDLNVIGYLGIPITMTDGQRLGSFCVIDTEPHDWSYVEIALVKEMAQLLTREIDLRAKARLDATTYQPHLARARTKINRLIDRLDIAQPQEDVLAQLRHLRDEIDI